MQSGGKKEKFIQDKRVPELEGPPRLFRGGDF
jgi:hypothetical protein